MLECLTRRVFTAKVGKLSELELSTEKRLFTIRSEEYHGTLVVSLEFQFRWQEKGYFEAFKI